MAFNKSNVARPAALAASINSSTNTLVVDDATGYPQNNFAIRIGDSYPWEIAIVGSRDGNVFESVERGAEGSSASAHSSGALVVHVATARDMVVQTPRQGHIMALIQDPTTLQYPERPGYVSVVHYFGWEEPPVDPSHPYDIWTQVDPPAGLPLPASYDGATLRQIIAQDAASYTGATLRSVTVGDTINKLESDSRVVLWWNEVGAADSYNVYRNTSNDFGTSTKVGDEVAGTSFLDTGLTNSTEYYYWATSVEGATESAPIGVIVATPIANLYSTNFMEYEVGQEPNDWTKRWVTDENSCFIEEDNNERYMEVLATTSGTARFAYTWDILDAAFGRENATILAEYSATGDNSADPRIGSHISGSAGAETGYVAAEGTGTSFLVPYDDGGVGGNEQGDSIMTKDGTKFFLEMLITRDNGSDTVEYRVWEKGTTRPTTPHLSFVRGSEVALDIGAIGISRLNDQGSVKLHFYSVGLNGQSPQIPN